MGSEKPEEVLRKKHSSENSLVVHSLQRGRTVSVETIEQRSTVRKLAPRYRVLLHNDDFNSMEYVVQTLIETVPSLTQPQAVNIMMEAHTNGLALVITCAQEHAEFYSETLKMKGLDSTIEPDE
jgi:ATP-dependent Clp protease adaptor protein ClpS